MIYAHLYSRPELALVRACLIDFKSLKAAIRAESKARRSSSMNGVATTHLLLQSIQSCIHGALPYVASAARSAWATLLACVNR
jgi:hypothetical protein